MEEIIQSICDIVWSRALVVLLVAAGLYFTIRTRFVQLRMFPEMHRLLFEKKNPEKGKKGISSFESFCISLSGRVGTGNIVGVATAIALGGPGAVFWMWLIAFFGAATAFVEATLAQKYKTMQDGQFRGGPFSYIEQALKQRWLAIVFALFCILGYGILMVAVQANSVTSAFYNAFHFSPFWTALAIVVLLSLVIVGGVKRIAKFAAVITPFMAIGYIGLTLIVIICNWRSLPDVFALIFKSAFGFGPVFGGMIGSAIAMGVRRGLFSNEAGQGGGAIISASADVEYPAQQGLIQSLSVYADTLLVCTATALMILCSGSYNVFGETGELIVGNAPELGTNYVAYAQNAIDGVIRGFGSAFISVALAFFVFTTLLVYYFYAESSLFFLFSSYGKSGSKFKTAVIWIYRLAFLGMIIIGAVLTADSVWTLGDIGLGLTTWINVIVILILCPEAVKCLRDYESSLKRR